MKPLIVVLASLIHLIPHPLGVSPIGATALYAGAYGRKSLAWVVPLIPLLAANLIFGFYDVRILGAVYLGFALSTFAGRWLLRNRRSYKHYATAVTLGATIFFLISNFSVWWAGMYPSTAAGLVQCYINGLPFLAVALLADAMYCFLLFGIHGLIQRQQTATAPT